MTTLLRVAAYVLTAGIVWTTCGAAMFSIPNSPHRRMLQSMNRLDGFSKQPPSVQANEAFNERANQEFDEFLRIGGRAHFIDSTLLTGLAALAVTVLSLWLSPLSKSELALVTGGFAALMTLRMGIHYLGWMDLLGVSVFATVLWTGRYWTRTKIV